MAHYKNSKGVPGPSLAQNPYFFSSLGRFQERSRQKQESSKYMRFYSLNLQWCIPWPLRGDPLAPKKTWPPGSWSPQGPTRREDTPPREPPWTSRARKPSFLKVSPPPLEASFGKHVVLQNHQKTIGISLFLHGALPFGSRNVMSRSLLGPSYLVHTFPRTSPSAPVGQTCSPRTPPGPPVGQT